MTAGISIWLVSRFAVAGVMTFLAIILWSRTRDVAWMLIVIGAVSSYAEVLFDLFVRMGLVDEDRLAFYGVPLARLLFSNLPYLFLAAAFIVMIARKGRH